MPGTQTREVNVLARKIESQYQALRLTPEKGDTWVVDRRNNHIIGPFAHADAFRMCADLNDFVRRNTKGDGVAFPFWMSDQFGNKA